MHSTGSPWSCSHADRVAGTEGLPFAAIAVSGSWTHVFGGETTPALEEVLRVHLAGRRWFMGRNREIASVRLLAVFPIPAAAPVACLGLVEVHHPQGDSEIYVYNFAFAPLAETEGESGRIIEAPIARLTVHDREGGVVQGILYDPTDESFFTKAMAGVLDRQRRFRQPGGELVAMPTRSGQELLSAAEDGPLSEKRWLLKVMRHVESGINPEVEASRFLWERAGFKGVPPILGTFEFRNRGPESLTVAVLEGFVANQGEAWNYTLEALAGYFERSLASPESKPQTPRYPHDLLEATVHEVPAAVSGLLGAYLESARLLGRRTAELHGALASVPDDPVFAPEPFTPLAQRSLYQSLRSQVRRTFEQLRQHRSEFAATMAEELGACWEARS